MDLKTIIVDNPINKRESYKIDFNADGSIKITQTDGKGVESEISAEQFAYLKEIDAIKNTLSTADDEVKKTVKKASVFAGTAVAGLVAGAGLKPAIEYFTRLKVPTAEIPKSEYQYDPGLVEKMRQIDLEIERINNIYGLDINFVTVAHDLLNKTINKSMEQYHPDIPIEDIISFVESDPSKSTFLLKRDFEVEADISNPLNEIIINKTGQKERINNLKNWTKKLFNVFIRNDRGRINKIFFRSKYENSTPDGSIKTEFGGDSLYPNVLMAGYHEAIHQTTGVCRGVIELAKQGDDFNAVHIKGYRSDLIADQLIEVTKVLANNPEFFNKYFFQIKGDELFSFLKNERSLERGLGEILAIASSKYLFGERENWLSEKEFKKYPDVERMIRRQLAVSIYGVNALVSNPDGINDEQLQMVRKEIGITYIDGLLNMIPSESIRNKVTEILKKDLSGFYSTDENGYIVSDVNKVDFGNYRFYSETDLNSDTNYLVEKGNIDFRVVDPIRYFLALYGRTFFPDGKIG